jgi:pyruvate formate lyase activating enzyme
MHIAGVQRLSLLDYPGKLSCIVFLPGCNLRCPFCHNAEIVTQNHSEIEESSVLEFIESRKTVLDGVCITGGEPTLQKDLPEFISKVKDIGISVKLDTNGTAPETLQYIIDNRLVDYIAMDIKTSLEKYPIAVGVESFTTDKIKRSIDMIMRSEIDYEFRTTVSRGIVELEDIDDICKTISGCKAYYLQKFVNSGNLVGEGDFEVSDLYMLSCYHRAKEKLENVGLRGVDL